MGHLLFIILHIVAILFGLVFLVVTIPLHLIYGATRRTRDLAEKNTPRSETHVRCPDCKELVLFEANVCKHCGAKLMPQSQVSATAKAAKAAKDVATGPWEFGDLVKNWSPLTRDVVVALVGGGLLVLAIVRAFTP